MPRFLKLFSFLIFTAAMCGNIFAMNDLRRKQVKVRAPELVGGRSWLNTDKPLSLAALKGKRRDRLFR